MIPKGDRVTDRSLLWSELKDCHASILWKKMQVSMAFWWKWFRCVLCMDQQMWDLSNIHVQMFLLTQSTLRESWLCINASSYNWIITIPSSLPVPRTAPFDLFNRSRCTCLEKHGYTSWRSRGLKWDTYMMNYFIGYSENFKCILYVTTTLPYVSYKRTRACAPTHTRTLKEASKCHN